MLHARRRSRGLAADGRAIANEAFRVLRANLLVALDEAERPSVIVTSAVEGEGKTSTCAQLARSLAVAGRRVVVLDLDLRHPDLYRWLGGHNEFGVTDVLLERMRLDEAMQLLTVGPSGRSTGRSLYFLAAGRRVENPTELLGGYHLARLLESLARQADIVLIDSAPILPVADTLVVGRIVGGAILVVEAHRTPITSVQRAKDALTRNQTRLYGVVVNKLAEGADPDGYGYGYGYGDNAESGGGQRGDRR